MTPTFAGEIQLAGWSDTHSGGAKVTFWLQSAEDLEVFKGLTAKKGNTAGHRFMAALVEVGDDEQPIPPNSTELKAPREPMGDACYRTVMWCKDPEFLLWANSSTHNGILWHVKTEQDAKEFVCELCGVESRRHLDEYQEANQRWHELIRGPYSKWLMTRKG